MVRPLGYFSAMSTDVLSHTEALAEHVDVNGLKVVDVGCGAGSLVRWLRRTGAEPIGVECGEQMRAMALDADPDHADSYVDGVGQDLPFDDASVDLVIYSYSLHHVPEADMRGALSEARRVLRPGGMLYVLEPVPDGPSFEVGRLIDDETHVRGKAQEALSGIADLGFELQTERSYDSSATYADFATYERIVVGIDPTRAERMAAVRDEVAARFEAKGTAGEAGWSFRQPNLLKIYTAV